jgi:hypothetical protein
LAINKALNINDRGEILVAADPVGVTPTDDDDLGHLILLVPCDADDADCGGNATSTTSVAQPNAARIKNASRTAQLMPLQKVASFRISLALGETGGAAFVRLHSRKKTQAIRSIKVCGGLCGPIAAAST